MLKTITQALLLIVVFWTTALPAFAQTALTETYIYNPARELVAVERTGPSATAKPGNETVRF